MELYTLDALLRRETVTDKFVSLIWTERFQSKGEFELQVTSTRRNRELFTPGTKCALNLSHRVMEIDEVTDSHDADGRKILEVKGESLERILEDRVAKATLSDTTTEPKWIITDIATDVARKIFHDICVTGVLDVHDVIPFINEGTFMPADTIAEPTEEITTDLDPTTVYQAIKDLADEWDFGFRILRFYDSSNLYFDVYMGVDRTTRQTAVPAVVFMPDLQNFHNTTELKTAAAAKNVAYVFSPAGALEVIAPGVDTDVEGFERRVLVVNASDITEDNPDVPGALHQRGKTELAKTRSLAGFDGEVAQRNTYVYGTDYNLGDIVEARNEDHVTAYMQVTEQIMVSDAQGERSYPTLSLKSTVYPGSWSTFGTRAWEDMGLLEFWEDQP